MTAENPSITREQAVHLATVLHDMRPRWSTESIVTLIGRNLETIPGFNQLAEAAIKVANDPTKNTPAVIFMDGEHWNHTTSSYRPPPGPPCEDHDTEPAHNCRCCWGDVKAGYRPETHIGKHYEPTEETP